MIMLDLLKAILIAIAVVIITTTLVARLGLKNVGLLLPSYKIKSSTGWSKEKIFELLATPVLALHVMFLTVFKFVCIDKDRANC